MAKEFFSYGETRPIFRKLEQLSRRSSVSRAQAFEDSLTAFTCAFAAETKEDEYLAMVERHKNGKPGRRGVDLICEMFAGLVNAMTKTESDILGDLFQGSITYGEAGQYLSPESVARLLADLSIDPDGRRRDGRPLLINDPACGTGRMLLEATSVNPDSQVLGQDIDARCAKISAVNLGLRGRYGWVVCGDTLAMKYSFAYRIGSFFHEGPNGLRRGVIRDIPLEQVPSAFAGVNTRNETKSLLTDDKNAKPDTPACPRVMEIPPALLRLEQHFAGSNEPDSAGQQSQPPGFPKDEPPKTRGNQLELF